MADEHVFDLLPGYALGILDEPDLLRVARHLPRCLTCREALATYWQTVDQMALSEPPRTPPPELRAKVIRRVAQASHTASGAAVTGPVGAASPPGWLDSLRGWFTPRAGWMLGAVALVLIVLLSAASLMLWQRVNDLQTRIPAGNALIVPLKGTPNAPQATGYLMTFTNDTYGTLTVRNAPQLDAAHQYQIWLVKDGKRTNGGVFDVTDEGYGTLMVEANQPLQNFQSFGITIEPKGGSPGPTGKKILGGSR